MFAIFEAFSSFELLYWIDFSPRLYFITMAKLLE